MSVLTSGQPTHVPVHPTRRGVGVPTFTRSGTATRVNSSGFIENVEANVPRFDYNPVTLALMGMLIEETRSNVLLFSGDIGGEGSPTIWRTTTATLTPDNATSPANDTTATLVTITANNGEFRQDLSGLTSGGVYCFSIFLKAGTVTDVMVRCPTSGANVTANLSAGTVSAVSSDGSPQAGVAGYIDSYGNGWYRVALVYTQSGTTESPTVREAGAGTTGTFFAWGAQMELGTCPTSYIPTTTAAVTRSADLHSITLDDWFDESEGSVFAEWLLGRDTMANSIWTISDGTTANIIRSRYSAAGTSGGNTVLTGGATQTNRTDTGQLTAGQTYREAFGWAENDFARAADDDTSADTDTDAGTIPSGLTLLRIGASPAGTEQPCAHLRKFEYYAERLANASLVARANGNEIFTEPTLAFDFSTSDIEEQTGSLDYPRILYHNLARDLTDASVAVSSESSSGPADAPLSPDTYSFWMPTSLSATWRVDLGSAKVVDACGIAAHDLGTRECSVKVQYSHDDSAWLDATDTEVIEDDDDSAVLLLFSPQNARYWRLVVAGVGSPTAIPFLSVIYFGQALTMQRSIYGGHSPLTLSRETVMHRALSRGGHFLGQGIRRVGFTGSASFRHLTPDWVREELDLFIESARQFPYFFAWRPSYSAEVAYCWTPEDIRPSNMGLKNFMQVNWPMRGFDSE